MQILSDVSIKNKLEKQCEEKYELIDLLEDINKIAVPKKVNKTHPKIDNELQTLIDT